MLKHVGLILFISILLISFSQYVQEVMYGLSYIYGGLNEKLSYIFNTNPIGNTTQKSICLLIIPIVLAAVPASIYWLVKRKLMPYFYHLVWGIWIILFITLVMTN